MINKVTPDEIASLRAALHGRKQPSVMLEHLIADYEDLMAQPATLTPAMRKAIEAAAKEIDESMLITEATLDIPDRLEMIEIITRHLDAALKEPDHAE